MSSFLWFDFFYVQEIEIFNILCQEAVLYRRPDPIIYFSFILSSVQDAMLKNVPCSHNVSTSGGEGLVSAFYQGEESLNNLPKVTEGGRRAKK